ncbi:hypothetical protein ASPZODRAFT_26186 [Penicilliopsis zonata CBS 506.65]|uniref:MIP18 family-like domain-containing protein n=1 Tax=Penicilliopsis zonata CBS 506.65 TaxID=1073090 RepID=A0A1L9SGQ9_9EURO|nr:hypothetical protein ASPZODRAFT_26186 [Penicilliopsis zonata CBS 506.65]OJJ46318.1 hypothetical protein ASPZODRAFT_26186 [Penicilliopsis zonata CBS 506.65]
MQNSNPTILSAADLPTRLRTPVTTSSVSGTGLLSSSLSTLVNTDDVFSFGKYNPDSDIESLDELTEEPIDEQEVFEHPISLGALAVVSLPDILIEPSLPSIPDSPLRTVTVLITPTISHCSLATVIGLGVRVRLEQSLPSRFRVDVRIKEGTHSTADEVNKQLADKERVAAALENGTLMGVIGKMLETCK